MYQFLLKISTLSLVLLCNNVSLSMEIFDIQKFPEDIHRHIFVMACPSIQNQLKNCNNWWHKVGVKKAPNMYRLLDDASFRPSQDDWRYIMMHAALDKNLEVMSKVLDRTNQRNFDYDFMVDNFGSPPRMKKSFRLCNVYDFKALLGGSSATVISETFKELDLQSHSDKYKVNFDNDLFRACFAGDIATVKKMVKQAEYEKCYQSKIYECIVISLYNNNPHCIELLFPLIQHIVMDDVHMRLLDMAMRNNKKHAFRALVQYDVFGRLNDPLLIHAGRKTTVLDELLEYTDVPNIAEYIKLCKELDCKTWQEVTDEEEEKKNSFFSACTFAGTFCSMQ